MPLKNTSSQYGSLTKIFHWLTALFILTALVFGMIAQNAPFSDGDQLARKAMLFSLHKTVGVTAFFVALARILWAMRQTRPGLLNAENRLEAFGAHLAHWLLYGSMVIVPLTGWIHHAATTGFAPILWPFGQNLPLIPKSESLADITSALHFIFMIVLVVSILAHVGGALKHFVIDRDQTLQRMLPGRHSAPVPTPEAQSRTPLFTALGIWALALGIGAGAGAFSHGEHSHATAQLTKVVSDWQVEQGTLGVTVTQFGSDVSGQFTDWTAAITFDETPIDGKHGQVEVTVAIGSLVLGSVTDQALGSDFLNAGAFSNATFLADILATETGYMANGSLTLKEVEAPVELLFDLQIDGDRATMTAQTTLNRLDFGVGANMPDEQSVGFAAVIDVALIATRSHVAE